MFVIRLFGILFAVESARSLRCFPCSGVTCTTPTNCAGGLVDAPCLCCKECAKQLGESCGGGTAPLGTCDEGLECIDSIFQRGGTCQSVTTVANEVNVTGNSTANQDAAAVEVTFTGNSTTNQDQTSTSSALLGLIAIPIVFVIVAATFVLVKGYQKDTRGEESLHAEQSEPVNVVDDRGIVSAEEGQEERPPVENGVRTELQNGVKNEIDAFTVEGHDRKTPDDCNPMAATTGTEKDGPTAIQYLITGGQVNITNSGGKNQIEVS